MDLALFLILLAVITLAIVVTRIVLVPREDRKRRREREIDQRLPASARRVPAWPPRDRQERPAPPRPVAEKPMPVEDADPPRRRSGGR